VSRITHMTTTVSSTSELVFLYGERTNFNRPQHAVFKHARQRVEVVDKARWPTVPRSLRGRLPLDYRRDMSVTLQKIEVTRLLALARQLTGSVALGCGRQRRPPPRRWCLLAVNRQCAPPTTRPPISTTSLTTGDAEIFEILTARNGFIYWPSTCK